MQADPPHAPGRVLLKLSGELLAGRSGCGLDPGSLEAYAGALVECAARGWRMGVVVGGGNFVRGGRSQGITRHRADWMGMLATVINAIALQDAIETLGGRAAVLSAFPVADQVAGFSPEAASELLDSGSTVIYAGGTGNPFLTTDTAAALRAVQTGCRLLLKGTKVDGIYDSDPVGNPSAKRFERLTYDDVLGLGLGVMDAAAVAVCRDSSLPLLVFDVTDPANILRALGDERLGTTVREEP